MVSHQDHLTEILETFPLEISFAGRFQLSAPWGLGVPEGMAIICSIVEGSCLATADTSTRETAASSGDVLLLSPGAEHRLQNRGGARAVPPSEWMAAKRAGDPLEISFGGGGPVTVLRGGVLQFDDPQVHPFYWGLPPVVHLAEDAVGDSIRLQRLLRLIDDEWSANLPGRLGITKRLVEILFVETARLCLTEADDASEAPMGQLLHPDLGPALALMHRQPEKSWTVAELAERVAMSRSAFADTFVKVLGRPPVQYLRERRMRLAERLLQNPTLGLKEIAQRVGYDSVSAFNSAFKQWWGIAPGRYRGRTKQ